MQFSKNKTLINEYKERAKELVAKMTLEEKVSQMLHDAPAIERLGVPAYNWWNEALHGVARAGVATMFPQAIGLAASFDEDMMELVADAISNKKEEKQQPEAPKVEEKQPEVKAEASTEDKTKEARKKKTGSIKIKVGSKIKKTEEAPAEEKQSEAQPSTKEAPQTSTNKTSTNEAPKAQKKTTPEGEKPAKAVRGGLYGARAKNEEIKRLEGLISREEPRYQQDMKPGGDSKQAAERMKKINDWKAQLAKLRGEATNEALSDLAVLLAFTNISESSFVEVMEMVAASKANAQKALERDEKKAMAAIDDINKDLEAGKPIDPEKVKNAEADHKKYERFKEIYDKKFNDNN